MSKHKLIAIIMAPFLAIAGFIGAGYLSEPEHPPLRVLTAERGCAITNADCELKSAEFELKLNTDQQSLTAGSVTIEMQSSAALDDVLISIAEEDQQSQPQRMKQQDDKRWSVSALVPDKSRPEKLMLRLVVSYQGVVYFADEKIK